MDLCPCGSGRRFDECCLPRLHEPADVEEYPRARVRGRLADFSTAFPQDRLDAETAYFGRPLAEVPEVGADEREDFEEFFHHDHRLRGLERTIVDLFAERHGFTLPSDEKEALADLRRSFLSVFEVVDVIDAQRARLRDLFAGGVIEVSDADYAPTLVAGEVFLARVYAVRDRWNLSPLLHLIAPYCRARVMAELTEEHGTSGIADRHEFLSRRGMSVPRRIWSMDMERRREALLTTEAMVHQARHLLRQPWLALERLEAESALELVAVNGGGDEEGPDEFRFEWVRVGAFGHIPRGPIDDDPVLAAVFTTRRASRDEATLGIVSIHVDRRELVLEAYSPEATTEGKAWLAGLLRGKVQVWAEDAVPLRQLAEGLAKVPVGGSDRRMGLGA